MEFREWLVRDPVSGKQQARSRSAPSQTAGWLFSVVFGHGSGAALSLRIVRCSLFPMSSARSRLCASRNCTSRRLACSVQPSMRVLLVQRIIFEFRLLTSQHRLSFHDFFLDLLRNSTHLDWRWTGWEPVAALVTLCGFHRHSLTSSDR